MKVLHAKEESTQNEKGQSSGEDAEVIEVTSGRMSLICSIESTQGRRSDKTFYQKEWKKVKVRNQRETIIQTVNMENSIQYDKQGRRSTG